MGQLEKQALTRNPIAHPGLELIELLLADIHGGEILRGGDH